MYRRVVLVMSAALAVFVGFSTSADARRHHRHHHHHHVSHHHHHGHKTHRVKRHSRVEVPAQQMASLEPSKGRSDSKLIHEANRYLGGNPTGWSHNWCGQFMNLVLTKTGHRGSGSATAISFARYGHPTKAQPGAIAVMRHHVAIVEKVVPGGVQTISGNHGHKVGRGFYPYSRIIAFRMP